MPRDVTFEVPLDTAHFSAQQLHPRAVLSIAMSGWARWVRAHLVPFRSLIRDHGVGVVVVGFEIEYRRAFTFFDADAVQARFATTVRADAALLRQELVCSSGPEDVVAARFVTRVVRITGGDSLAAQPGVLPAALLERFAGDERFEQTPARPLASLVDGVPEWSPERSSPLVVHRERCEAADQWSFIELPGMVARARESMLLDGPVEGSVGLATPTRRVVAELGRPFFIFDRGTVQTRHDPSYLQYLHRVHGASAVHATVYEELGTPTGGG